VLGRRDEHAFLHQAGGITDASHVAADRLDLEVVEIGSAKHNASSRSRRQHAHGDRRAAV